MNSYTGSEILLYQTEDGQTKIDVKLAGETVWLTLNQMAELFQRDKSVVSRHIKNIFDEGELNEKSTVALFATVQTEGNRRIERNVAYYNLDVIISVGYRVKSQRGTQFRIWATQRLREYIIKGFTMNDDLLKQAGGGNYFDELLARIRDIRSSEKVFYRKVLEIYATSIDYDPRAEATQHFFKTVQNKMHWAITGQTAAELIYSRANAEQSNMGLTSYRGAKPRKQDVATAKNYLNEEELAALNNLVEQYLIFAQGQAMRRIPMTMADWISKLDSFLNINDRDVLTHAGKISHEMAKQHAELEYEKFHRLRIQQTDQQPSDFEQAVKHLQQELKDK